VEQLSLCAVDIEMSAEEETLPDAELDPTDGDMYEVGDDDAADGGQPSWSSLTVAALKSALVERGLQTTGRKAELVARLEACQTCMHLCGFIGYIILLQTITY